MNVHAACWLVCLNLIKFFCCDANNPFVLKEKQLTVVEGSCAELKCESGRYLSTHYKDYWFWIKDATWTEEKGFSGSVIYSSDKFKRSIDPLFKDRVRPIDSSPSWSKYSIQSEKLCNIFLCDLKKEDSGEYSFRFHGKSQQWMSEPRTTLTVVANPCPIRFEEPEVVKENEVVTLTCSTLSSCLSNLQIFSLTQQPSAQLSKIFSRETRSSKITQSFNVSWQDDGIEFSCQNLENKDKYLIKKVNLKVEYAPKDVKAEKSSHGEKEGESLTLTCSAKGRPSVNFNWFKNNQKLVSGKELEFTSINASDRGSYNCEAENKMGTGKSNTLNINVLFLPTNVQLSMPAEVREGQLVTTTCTAESFPPSTFKVEKSSTSNLESSPWNAFSYQDDTNTFINTFTASATHAGSWLCTAFNSQGTAKSAERKLEVKYSPRNVTVRVRPNPVKENESFSLDCSAQSEPSVASFTWMKTNKNKESVVGSERTYSVKSARPSDSGLYRCSARNEIGIGKSRDTEVIVMHAPKHTTIIKGEEQQWSDGRRSMTLICSSLCYPPATYVWYNETDHVQVSTQNITVYSDRAGEYYCTAENEMGRRSSELTRPFDDINVNVMMIVRVFLVICCFLLFSPLLYFFFRHWRFKSVQQGHFLGARVGNVMSDAGLVPSFRRRNDFLSEQPGPDVTTASSTSNVYYTVNQPNRNQAPAAQNPASQQHGHLESGSLYYVSLNFDNKQKKTNDNVAEPVEEREKERLHDYENISAVHAARPPNPLKLYDSDSETSEDDVEVSYTHVDIKSKPGHETASKDSSTSEDEIQYSHVKI